MARKILVVDDDALILQAVEFYFGRCGFEVDTCQELEEARALLSPERYSIVITDLRLTHLHRNEGLEVISCARGTTPSTLVVMVTGSGSPEIAAEARRRGVDAFVHKPFDLPRLREIVESLLLRASQPDCGEADA